MFESEASLDHAGSCSSGSCGTHDNGTGCGSHAKKPAEPAIVELNLRPLTGPGARPTTHCKGLMFQPTERYPQGLMIGLDVGSTTVKAVVVNPMTDEILWK